MGLGISCQGFLGPGYKAEDGPEHGNGNFVGNISGAHDYGGIHGGADQGSIRDAEAARLAQANNEAARLAAEQARKEEAAAAAKRAADIKRQDEKVRAERARQIAADEKVRSRILSAKKNGKASTILTSPGGVLNPVFTTSSQLWGHEAKFKKTKLGQ